MFTRLLVNAFGMLSCVVFLDSQGFATPEVFIETMKSFQSRLN